MIVSRTVKLLLLGCFFQLIAPLTQAQVIYSKAFGKPTDKPIIFLHGGPGYNGVNFEVTTAQKLADKGFYVIVYDRRGEGRSEDAKAQFTFRETFDDLDSLYIKYHLTQASLIGHSFGGIVATLFAESYPQKVKSVFLVGAPVALQETFKTIISASKTIYQAKNDSVNLKFISMLEKMDTASLEYSGYSFGHAMQNRFYTPKNPSEEAKLLYAMFKTDSLLMKYGSKMTYKAPKGFWEHEHYTTLDITKNLEALVRRRAKIYGLYGKDDGLYSAGQVAALQKIIGENNLEYLNDCSHNVFVDQQPRFIDVLVKWSED